MGLKDDGIYNGDDVKFSLQGRTYEEKKEITKNEIKKRLNEYGVGGLLKHLYKNPLMESEWMRSEQYDFLFMRNHCMKGWHRIFLHWKGKYSNTVLLLMKCVYLFYLSSVCLALVCPGGEKIKYNFAVPAESFGYFFRFAHMGRLLKDTYFCLCCLFFSLAAEELENIYVYLRKR